MIRSGVACQTPSLNSRRALAGDWYLVADSCFTRSDLLLKLEAAERELATLKAQPAQLALNPLRKTLPAAASEMLAKHGIGDGPVNVRALDAALAGLGLEQRG